MTRRASHAGVLALVLGAVALATLGGSAAAAGAPAGNATNASFEYGGDLLTVEASAGQVVAGRTALPAGEPVTVRIRSTGGSPFLRSPQATVGADGRFEATVDLHQVAPGAPFEAALLHNGTTLATASGLVTECERDCEPTPRPDDGVPDAGTTGERHLVEDVVQARRGTTATIPLAFHGTDVYAVTVGSEAVNYRLTATVQDADGDGRARLLFNTANAGQDPATVAVAGDDTVTVTAPEPALDAPLDPAGYDIAVANGTGPDAAVVERGTLVVAEAANGTVTPEPIASATGADATVGGDGDGGGPLVGGRRVAGIGAIALGGLLAVVGLGFVLGFGRR